MWWGLKRDISEATDLQQTHCSAPSSTATDTAPYVWTSEEIAQWPLRMIVPLCWNISFALPHYSTAANDLISLEVSKKHPPTPSLYSPV